MEYITAEQFLEQDKEVQKVFLDWWKPSVGDLYCLKNIVDIFSEETFNSVNCISHNYDKESKDFLLRLNKFVAPLLTEGQLRKFIEDITGFKVDLVYYSQGGYTIALWTKENSEQKSFENLGENVLQAYWKVALEIAKESVKSEN